MKSVFFRFLRDDSGQDLVEYALLSSAVAFAGIAVFPVLEAGLVVIYQQIQNIVGNPQM